MELFKKVFIKSEQDLPKERGYYFVHLKKNYERLPNKSIDADYFSNDGDKTYVKSWMNAVDFYLQPEPEMTEKEIKEMLQHYEIYKAVNGLNNSGKTYEEIIEKYIESQSQITKLRDMKDKLIIAKQKEIIKHYENYVYNPRTTPFDPDLVESLEDDILNIESQSKKSEPEISAKKFLESKGIFSLDTKKRTLEVYEWMEEFARQFSAQSVKETDNELIKSILEIADYAPELNMGNYSEDQVSELNNAMIEVNQLCRKALNATPPSDKVTVTDAEIKMSFNQILTSNEYENHIWYDLSIGWKGSPQQLVNTMYKIWDDGAKWMRDHLYKQE